VIKVYPLPADEFVMVDNIVANNSYRICDVNGKIVATGIVVNGRIRISNLTNGEYVLNILEHGNIVLTKKILVIH